MREFASLSAEQDALIQEHRAEAATLNQFSTVSRVLEVKLRLQTLQKRYQLIAAEIKRLRALPA